MKTSSLVESHLTIHQKNLSKAEEWSPRLSGWCFAQIKTGCGYWQVPSQTLELSAGALMCIHPKACGIIRASQLHDVTVRYFWLDPGKLSGVLSVNEQQAFNRMAAQDEVGTYLFAPDHPHAKAFAAYTLRVGAGPLTLRLKLLQLALDAIGADLERKPVLEETLADSRARLRQVLSRMAAAELAELSLLELAPKVFCSPRHLRRLFREEVGISFREKQTELRLAKACELLVNTDAKIVDVGLSSGYHSNSLFSSAFKKRFGVSPGEWRQLNAVKTVDRSRSQRLTLV
jgi:AraC-like DNA-binding protein